MVFKTCFISLSLGWVQVEVPGDLDETTGTDTGSMVLTPSSETSLIDRMSGSVTRPKSKG